MKLLSVAIPCYNSEAYMGKCIESLLPGGEDVEILIINDGSVDRTRDIADEYERKYPNIVRAIHQENGGHGEAVNAGIRNAKGLYYKVVDSDDWVKTQALLQVLDKLRELVSKAERLDMMVCNFVYEKEGMKKKKVMTYHTALPKDELITWDDVKLFLPGQYMLMHSVIYRTQILRDCGLELPKHTFYVDNIFVFQPLPFVKTLYYMDVNLYRYFIGREDQSVNEKVMIGRIDQQIRVNKLMVDYMAFTGNLHPKIRHYMMSYLEIITTVTSIMLIKSGTEENLLKKRELWEYIRIRDRRIFFRLRFGVIGSATNLPGKGGRKISVAEYKIARRFVGFN